MNIPDWVIEIKGPDGVKQVEISDEKVKLYHRGLYEYSEYAVAAFLASIGLMTNE